MGGTAYEALSSRSPQGGDQAPLTIADRAFDADSRVLEPLAAAGKSAVIPPRANRVAPREFDRELYKERHLAIWLNWCTRQSWRSR